MSRLVVIVVIGMVLARRLLLSEDPEVKLSLFTTTNPRINFGPEGIPVGD